MRSILPIIGMVTTAVVMTGCQTAADPHEGGFISGIWNLTTGGYESRVVAKQTDVATQQATQEQLRQQEVALSQEHAQVERELNEAEQRLAALDEDIQGYRSRLQQERRLRDSDRARLHQAEASVNQIRALLTQAKQANQDKGTDSDVHDQAQAIQARLSNLQDLVYTLASH
jgi:chromosome segregation ATPase